MTLMIAVAASAGAAAAFGTASAVQFRATSRSSDGEVDPGLLAHLLHDPLWLSGVVADALGLLLQVVALANGPVSLVQPIQVLGLLVAIPVATMLGAPRPARSAIGYAALLVSALAAFLVVLGDPGEGRVPHSYESSFLTAGMLAGGGLACLLSNRSGPLTKATVYGVVSGAWFSLTAVLLRSVSLAFSDGRHFRAFLHPRGLTPLICLVVAGAAAIILSQAAFQVGPLTASLPAQSAADPLTSVLLGTLILGEHIPLGHGRLVLYVVTLAALFVAARQLSAPAARGQQARDVGYEKAP